MEPALDCWVTPSNKSTKERVSVCVCVSQPPSSMAFKNVNLSRKPGAVSHFRLCFLCSLRQLFIQQLGPCSVDKNKKMETKKLLLPPSVRSSRTAPTV